MDSIFKKFYRQTYINTGGYIPCLPNCGNVFPGDFFQIKNGEMILLGNIFNPSIIDPFDTNFQSNIQLNPSNWTYQNGMSKPYSGRGTGQNPVDGQFEFSKQVLAFDAHGSFVFKGNDPKAFRMDNWNEIRDQLIIKLTQTYYSFRELYLVTDCASLSDYTLAIAGKEGAELEIATEEENFGLVDLFGHHSSRTIQSKEMAFYHREEGRKLQFFKAKKLMVQDGKVEVFISDLINQRANHQTWANGFYEMDFVPSMENVQIERNAQASILDMLQGNQLNPNTALTYFKWGNADLDDIERLFISYGG